MRQRAIGTLLLFGFALATTGLSLMLTGCASTESNYRGWVAASVVATAADVATTIAATRRGAQERNPALAPLFKNSPAAGGAAIITINYGVIRLANKQRRAGDPNWAVGLIASTAVHSLAATANATQQKKK